MKYRTDRPVPEISELLLGETQQIDGMLKARLAAFAQSKAAVAAAGRKHAGTLATKDLAAYVTADDFVRDSEYMTTLLAVVPVEAQREWETRYERLGEMVVPRSSRLLAVEDGLALYTVTVFNRTRAAFVSAAAEHKFVVREFAYDEARLRASAAAEDALQGDLKAQWASLVRLLKTNFGEIFSAWIHLKVLRVYVEAVLHYGLPPHFLALTLALKPAAGERGERRLRAALLQHLEQLQLPGISAVDVVAALHSAGARTARSRDDAEEDELWDALNMSTRDEDPFVKTVLRWHVQ